MLRFSVIPAALVLASGLGACGQSGPLYMPGNPSQITTEPPGPVEPSVETPEDDGGESEDRNDRDNGDTN